jgi:hypothetical protein
MPGLTRRDLFRFCNVALGAHFANPLLAAASFEPIIQPGSNYLFDDTPISHHIPLDHKLLKSVNDSLFTTFTKLHTSHLTRPDLAIASRAIHIYATHLSDTGLESTINIAASTLSPDAILSSRSDFLDSFLAHCKESNLSIPESKIWPLPASITHDITSTALSNIAHRGISTILHESAAVLATYSHINHGSSKSYDNTDLHSQIRTALLSANDFTSPHLQYIQQCTSDCNPWFEHCPPPKYCNTIAAASAGAQKALENTIKACRVNPEAFSFCESLVAAADNAAEYLAALSIWPWVIIGSLWLIVCT